MSGTSLDGVDIAFCEFVENNGWQFRLLKGDTIPYNSDWQNRLSTAQDLPAYEFSKLNVDFGEYLGNLVKEFCTDNALSPDFVSSHGHTIFHRPLEKVTLQIGSGAAISASSQLPVVCDFRSLDVAMGGQGAPVVPVGDKYLFSEYDYCLNLGGIANISFDENGNRKAFDICACNMVLNHYAAKRNLSFDEDGKMAAAGKINRELLMELASLSYYKKSFPKSLGREDVERDVFPVIEKYSLSVEDVLATFSAHIGDQVASTIGMKGGKMLVTGGGAFNKTVIKQISDKVKVQTQIPDKDIINFKEAIIFGFLGVLRMRNMVNCLSGVTGAETDNCGGAVYFSKKNNTILS
jgi:anhydro-N-acetylmuramic acid kinase